MGLAIVVGDDEFAEELAELSDALGELGIKWREPEPSGLEQSRAACTSFPYSAIHYLRRVYALRKAGLPITPISNNAELEADSHLVAEESSMFTSHLLNHSDCEGYYIPVDFGDPEVADDGFVGSSQGLLAELRLCAPAIGIRLAADQSLSDEEAELINQNEGDFQTERMAWIALHEACLLSIASGHAIVFC